MMQTQIIEEIYKRINTQISNLQTEEATKHALVLPFLQAMGYDPFNPEEIVPEYTADFGVKSGEKVDYAIMKDGTPIILIECKKAGSTLDVLHASQLGRYFNVTPARIGILTNGVHYSFFSDLEQENRMDEHPFLQVDLSSQEGINNRNLRHFTKANFETDEAYEIAGNLKYIDVMQNFLENAYTDPPEEFVRMMAKQVYQGALTRAGPATGEVYAPHKGSIPRIRQQQGIEYAQKGVRYRQPHGGRKCRPRTGGNHRRGKSGTGGGQVNHNNRRGNRRV